MHTSMCFSIAMCQSQDKLIDAAAAAVIVVFFFLFKMYCEQYFEVHSTLRNSIFS